MNDVELQFSSELFGGLLSNPVFKVLSAPIGESHPLSPHQIQNKLMQRSYSSTYDFLIDFRSMMLNIQRHYEGQSSFQFAIEDIYSQFNRKIMKIPHTKNQFIRSEIHKEHKKLSKIRWALSLTQFDITQPPKDETPKPPKKHNSRPPTSLMQELHRAINDNTDLHSLVIIAEILKENIPNFELQENVVLDASTITAQCANELAKVLLK
jgi:hypothetical protein